MNAQGFLKFNSQLALTREAMFPCTLQIGSDPGMRFSAATVGVKTSTELSHDGGGLLKVQRISFSVRRAFLLSVPESGSRVTWVERKQEFRVDVVSDNGDIDPSLHLNCIGTTEAA